MGRKSLTAALAFSLLLLTSCGSRQLLAAGGNTADGEAPPTEQSETADQTEPTEQMEQSETADQPEPTGQIGQTGHANHETVQDYSSAEALRRPEHAWLYYSPESIRDVDGAEEM